MPNLPIKNSLKYSVIDIETTGANSYGQKIIEIAIINYDGFVIEESWSTLINPEKNISQSITYLTGITNEMVIAAPKFYEVAKKIVEMTEGRTFVAHNVFFDYRFIQREFNELGFNYRRDVFCTCKSARSVFKGLDSYSLQNLCKTFNFKRTQAHRALSDAQDCLDLFKKIQNTEEIKILKEQYDHLLPAQLEGLDFEDYPESPGLYFMYDEKDVLLYVGKSKNIRSRLKQHFKQLKGIKREQHLKQRVTKVEFMECYHELPTGILELHYIKNFKPLFNRAGRKQKFAYGLRLCPFSEKLEAGEELKVTKMMEGIPLLYSFGSKQSAIKEKETIYQEVFGIGYQSLHFPNQIKNLKKVLGSEKIYTKIKKKYDVKTKDLPDLELERKDWGLKLEENTLKEIRIKDQVIKIEETPDMRAMLIKKLATWKYLDLTKASQTLKASEQNL